MAILVDQPINHGKGNITAHLVSDSSLKELHEFAKKMGIKKELFHTTASGFSYYQVNIPQRLRALDNGARDAKPGEFLKASLNLSK